jgi:hypothetical protein
MDGVKYLNDINGVRANLVFALFQKSPNTIKSGRTQGCARTAVPFPQNKQFQAII